MARMPLPIRLPLTLPALLPASVMAQTETVTSTAPTVTSMLKMGLMLGVVIFMFIAFAWIMKRMTGLSPRGGDGMKVTGGLSLGQRERLVMVEVDNQRLLLGVTQQNITLIREMPAGQSFDATLKQAMPENRS